MIPIGGRGLWQPGALSRNDSRVAGQGAACLAFPIYVGTLVFTGRTSAAWTCMPAPRWRTRWTSRPEKSSKPDYTDPAEVTGRIKPLPGPATAIYKAGPTGYGLAKTLLSNDIRTLVAARPSCNALRGRR